MTRNESKYHATSLCAGQERNAEEEELEALRQWVQSLSAEELCQAMNFSFYLDDGSSAKNGPSSSHEFDLLREMIDVQCPPPVPVHPRCVTMGCYCVDLKCCESSVRRSL